MPQMTGDQVWVPEFEGQRPPFEPGNAVGVRFEPSHEASVVHGAYSPRKVDPLAQEIVDALLEDPSTPAHVTAPRYRLELLALGRAEARVQLLTEWLTSVTREGELLPPLASKRVKSAHLELHRAESRASSARTRLGLTPVSAARLGKNVAQGQAAGLDVAQRMAQQHAAEQALERARVEARADVRAELEAEGWRPPEPGDRGADDASAGGGVIAGQRGDHAEQTSAATGVPVDVDAGQPGEQPDESQEGVS